MTESVVKCLLSVWQPRLLRNLPPPSTISTDHNAVCFADVVQIVFYALGSKIPIIFGIKRCWITRIMCGWIIDSTVDLVKAYTQIPVIQAFSLFTKP